MKFIRWLIAKVFGPPLCAGCEAYSVSCVGHCGLDQAERERQFIEKGGV